MDAALIPRPAGLALLVAGLAALGGCAPLELKPFVTALEAPVHVSHRGGSGTAPEDTMVAFELAVAEYGTDMLELDVHASSDGVLVVHHDDELDRTTDGSGALHDHTLAELRALDAGYWFTTDDGETYPWRGQGVQIPTLEEVLEGFPDVPLSIEAKQEDPPIVEELAAMVVAYDRVDSVMLTAFSDDTIAAIQQELPEVATNYGENATRCVVFQHLLQAGWGSCPAADVLTVPPESSGLTVITAELVASAHARGVPVLAWTIDDRDEMTRLLDLGVDGIMTDRPDVLREVLAER